MERVDSKDVLRRKGYEYISFVEPGSEPSYADIRFADIVEELSATEIGGLRLYSHQLETYVKLRDGCNIVLRAGTGSGKTESWVLFLLDRVKRDRSFTAMVLYPTLALANDQIRRLSKYLSSINSTAVQIDSVRKDELVAQIGAVGVKKLIATSNLVITNPAFLLHDLKKYLVKKDSAILAPVYQKLGLLVIDELDFYGPRSLALLLAMVKLMSKVSDRGLQVAVLSAGISNPEDLCSFLQEETGKKCYSIEGSPFKVENHTYIVLGKNLEYIWRTVKNIWSEVTRSHPELSSLDPVVSSFQSFREKAYQVLSILESLGYDMPRLSVDPAEIIAEYFRDKYVTIVFTRSISSAEELVRRIKQVFGEEAPIASHHHLVSKKIREEVEEKARRGEIKVIVSPRTLSQGIDIGLVARIVHLGLPDNVREFYQREGRKGRRREIEFSETIIIPYTDWDRNLLNNGVEALRAWLGLGLEKTLVDPGNLYIFLLTGVIKLISPWFKIGLDEKEKEVLRRVGVIGEDGSVDYELLKNIYEKINFYEYAPPYGIKRYIIRSGKQIPLEPVGHCDLVEKFQPGCLDYSEDAMVVQLETGRSSRFVKSIIEKPLREIDFREYDGLAQALEEYRYLKLKWGEEPHILRDLFSGRVSSEVLCVVYVPRDGFGKYVKVPNRCIWTVKSEKPRYLNVGKKLVVYYDKRTIHVPMPTGGEYRDYTYGYTYPMSPSENADLARLALAYIIVSLRRELGIPLGTIMYDVSKIGEYKYFSLHEPEAAGLIEKIDWGYVRKLVENRVPDDLDRILISEVDDIAYSTLTTIEFDWDLVKAQAVRVVDYILARDRVRVVLRDLELTIPKPSPALKLLSLSIISEVLENDELSPSLLTALCGYDGEKSSCAIALHPPIPYMRPPRQLLDLENYILEKIFYEDYSLVVEDTSAMVKQAKQSNLRRLVTVLESGEKTIDFSSLLKEAGLGELGAEEIAEEMGEKPRISHGAIRELLGEIGRRGNVTDKEASMLTKYLEFKSKSTYLAYLAVREVVSRRKTGERPPVN